jgi:hypothetical protein
MRSAGLIKRNLTDAIKPTRSCAGGRHWAIVGMTASLIRHGIDKLLAQPIDSKH